MAKSTYIITYDLAAGGDYEELINQIKSYKRWAHITLSTWAVNSDKSATEIRDELDALMPDGSRVFVIRSGGAAAWRNVICRREWLKNWL